MKKLNPLKLKDYSWKDIDILLSVEEYARNNQLAIMLYEKETWEDYTDLSVFIKDLLLFSKDIKSVSFKEVNTLNNPSFFNIFFKPLKFILTKGIKENEIFWLFIDLFSLLYSSVIIFFGQSKLNFLVDIAEKLWFKLLFCFPFICS